MDKAKVVVITGASAGIGRATVHAFSKLNAYIGIIARDRNRLEETAKEAKALGGKTLILPLDVTNAELLAKAAETIEKEFGPIDIWVNNAMVSVLSPAKLMTASEYKRVTEVTYLGYVYGTLSALNYMIPRDKGIIIQVGSALAYRGIPLQSAYSAAKHAIEGFTESLRCELMHDKSKVKISMIQLPAINTPQFNWIKNRMHHKPKPVPPIFQPELAAEAIVWASYHYRAEWVIGGSASLAISINKIVPRIGDWYLAKTGYKSQQYDGKADPNQPNNLYESIPGNFGSHGDFDHLAKSYSLQVWLSRYRLYLLLLLVVLSVIILFV